MLDCKEDNIPDRLLILEKRMKELEEILKKEKDLFLDEYLKVQGFK